MATDKTENEEVLEDTEEETTEEEETDTEDTEETTETDEDEEESEEDTQLLKERARILSEKLARREHELERLKKAKEKPAQETATPASDYERLYLVATGYKDKAEQDEILAAATRMGVSIEDASSDEYVLRKIETMRAARKSAASVSRPSNGSAPLKKDVDYYVRKGTPPSDPKMYDEWEERMAKKAQGSSF